MEKSHGALENKRVLVKFQESKREQQRSLPTLGEGYTKELEDL